jgi:glucose-1-phosphate thymidylyltransferase
LEAGAVEVEVLGRGYAWLDTGTHENLLQAGEFVRTIEQRQGLKIGCLEEVAYWMGFIDKQTLLKHAVTFEKSGYGRYLQQVAKTPKPL